MGKGWSGRLGESINSRVKLDSPMGPVLTRLGLLFSNSSEGLGILCLLLPLAGALGAVGVGFTIWLLPFALRDRPGPGVGTAWPGSSWTRRRPMPAVVEVVATFLALLSWTLFMIYRVYYNCRELLTTPSKKHATKNEFAGKIYGLLVWIYRVSAAAAEQQHCYYTNITSQQSNCIGGNYIFLSCHAESFFTVDAVSSLETCFS